MRRRFVSLAVYLGCAWPLLWMAADAFRGRLGANPVEALLNRLGFWALTFLLLSLLPTPLKLLLGWTEPLRFRRRVGLTAFAYALLHFGTYVGADQFFDVSAIVADIVKRKFITVGFATLVLLTPLAFTSTDAWVRRLGFVRWKRLHRLVYLAAILGVVHYVWRVKADLSRPLVFAVLLAILLALRLLGTRSRETRNAVDPQPPRSPTGRI